MGQGIKKLDYPIKKAYEPFSNVLPANPIPLIHDPQKHLLNIRID